MNDGLVVLLLYVDDLFLTREEKLITNCKRKLAAEFDMKDLGPMHYFLGLEVWQSPEKIFLNQGKYAVEIIVLKIETSTRIGRGSNLNWNRNR
jgi:hypothetical protein